MKNLLLLIICFILAMSIKAQTTPEMEWPVFDDDTTVSDYDTQKIIDDYLDNQYPEEDL